MIITMLQLLFGFLSGILTGAAIQRLTLRCNGIEVGMRMKVLTALAVVYGFRACECTTGVRILFCVGAVVGSALQPVGLTGGIACGKSSVASMFGQDASIAVIDVDGIAHQILEPGVGEAYVHIVKEFGSLDIFEGKVKHDGKNPRIHRRKLGEVIFSDSVKRRKLNSITHPIITKIMLIQMILLKIKGTHVVIVDIPLLFEGRLQWLFGLIITVACSPEIQLRRLRMRNKDLSEEQCKDRIASQMSIDLKCKQSNIVLGNNGTFEDLEKNAIAVKNSLLRKHGRFSLAQLIFFVGVCEKVFDLF